MDQPIRVLAIILGALLGASISASLASPAGPVLGAILGALAAFGIVEFIDLRARVNALQVEVARLKNALSPGVEALTIPKAAAMPEAQVERSEEAEAETSFRDFEPRQRPVPTPVLTPQPPQIPFIAAIVRFFTGGNTVVRAGVVILFFGVAFLLRYMAEHTHVPVEIRLAGIAFGGVVLLILGWRLRASRAGYALALQGGGIGILYLTVFAALRPYGILPSAVAFPLLSAIGGVSAMLAVKQDSMAFALLGITGGFLAPVLASTGGGSHVLLFSYYALLNAGILAMAWYKPWQSLNVAGFVFTFVIGTVWGVLRYRPEAFTSTEPFLILFFLFYFAIAILFTLRRSGLNGLIDGTLVFGTPIVVFSLQSLLLRGRSLSLAVSAVAMGAVYLLAVGVLGRRGTPRTLMIESFQAIGVAFLTLAIPLALDARWNAAAWALEGAALVWVGCRQNRVLARVSGALLIVAAECISAFGLDLQLSPFALRWASYFEIVLQSAAALFAALSLHDHRDRLTSFESVLPHGLFWLGLFVWCGTGFGEISAHWPAYRIAGYLILTTLTTLACSELHRFTAFHDAKVAALLQFPMMLALAGFSAVDMTHPFAQAGWLAWPLAFGGLSLSMYRHEGTPEGPLAKCLETGTTWLFCGLSSWQAAWSVDAVVSGADSWPDAAWAVVPALFLCSIPRLVSQVEWPFAKNRDTYCFAAGVGMASYLCVWSCWTSVISSGDSAPLPYLPLLNPQDLAQVSVLLVLARYWIFLKPLAVAGQKGPDRRLAVPVLSVIGFIWLNAALLRTLHQWFGLRLDPSSVIASTLAQTSLSIFWAIIAFNAMVIAARRGRRKGWIAGVALLAVVIAKLFLVDLSRIGTVERIVSFLGVGLLMLAVGYLSPLPPAEDA